MYKSVRGRRRNIDWHSQTYRQCGFIGTIEIILKGDWQKGFERMTLEGVIYDYDYSHRVTLDLGEIDGLIH